MTRMFRHFRHPTALLAFLLICCALDSSARTLAEVRSLGAISMCANRDALPFASDKADSPGFQVELARLVAQHLGVALNIEWILPRRRANVVNCDMLFDTFNDPRAHEGRLLLSRPYSRSSIALGFAKGVDPVDNYLDIGKGRKVGVMINSVASVTLGKAGVFISPYAFESDLIDDLVKGELYAGAVSAASLSYFIHRNPDSGLRLTYAFDNNQDLTWQVAIGLRKSDQALVDAVNEQLERLLADGTIAAIYAKYGVRHRAP
jgi:polar amino acid transport system substrate-binding protein